MALQFALKFLIDGGKTLTTALFRAAVIATKGGKFMSKTKYAKTIDRQANVISKFLANRVDDVKNKDLSGRVVKSKTGRLKDSIKFRLSRTATGYDSQVYTDSKLGVLLNDGGSGVSIIKSHSEKRTKVFNKTVSSYTRPVPSHSRKFNFKKRNFIEESVNSTQAQNKLIQELTKNIIDDEG